MKQLQPLMRPPLSVDAGGLARSSHHASGDWCQDSLEGGETLADRGAVRLGLDDLVEDVIAGFCSSSALLVT